MECNDLEVPSCLPLAVINGTTFWNIPKEPFHQVLLIRNQVVMKLFISLFFHNNLLWCLFRMLIPSSFWEIYSDG